MRVLEILCAYGITTVFTGLWGIRIIDSIDENRERKGLPRLPLRRSLAYEGIALLVGSLVMTVVAIFAALNPRAF